MANHLSQPKQKVKKQSNIKLIILPVVALLLLVTLVGLPSVSEARRRHRRSWWNTSSTSTTNTTASGTGTTTTTTTPNTGSTAGTTNTNTTTPTTPPTTTTTPSTPATTPSTTTTPTVPSTTTSSTMNVPFLSNLVGYWKLNGNASGALGKDNATTFGNVSYVPGKFGQAAHFDGKSYLEIADKDYFSPSTTGQKMTVSYWIKPDDYNFTGINQGYVNLLGKSDFDHGANSEWEFRLYNENAYDGFSRSERMSFYAFNKEAGLGAGSGYNKSCPLGQWTHVVGVLDGANTRLYLNGKLVDHDPLSDYNIHMSNTIAPLRIGTSDKESFFRGSLSNVMIYNRNLSDTEVAQLYSTDLSK